MDRVFLFHGLGLHDTQILNEQVETKKLVQPATFVDDGNVDLTLTSNLTEFEFGAQSFFINAFQQPWTAQDLVNFNRGAENLTTQLILGHPNRSTQKRNDATRVLVERFRQLLSPASKPLVGFKLFFGHELCFNLRSCCSLRTFAFFASLR